MRRIWILLMFFSIAAAVSAQLKDGPDTGTAKPVDNIEEIYLAKDDGSGKAGDPVSSFVTTDIPIYCVVKLASTKPATVKMNFVAVDVAGVKPESKVVSVSYATKDGQNRVNFTGRPGDKWSAGKYRVEILIDGKLARDVDFEIRAANIAGASFFQPKAPPKPKQKTRPREN